MRLIEILPDPGALAPRAAEAIANAVASARDGRTGPAVAVALSGGSSLAATYRLLGERGTLREADVWFVDERCVSPDSPDSNARLVRETLGDSVGAVHRVRAEAAPDEAASAYEDEIRSALGPAPVFDVLVLGMGTDGHTASLFVDSPELAERERLAVATRAAHGGFRRVTLTLPVLNRARSAMFIVSGPDKAHAFARIQAGELLPAGRILGATWLVDEAAATHRPAKGIEQERLFEP